MFSAALLAANLLLCHWLITTAETSRLSKVRAANQVLEAQGWLSEHEDWNQKGNWIRTSLPKYDTRGDASSHLLNRVQEVAKESEIKLTDQRFIEESLTGSRPSVTLRVIATGKLESIVKWLVTLQSPDQFIAVPALTLKPSEDSMKCEITFIHFYEINR